MPKQILFSSSATLKFLIQQRHTNKQIHILIRYFTHSLASISFMFLVFGELIWLFSVFRFGIGCYVCMCDCVIQFHGATSFSPMHLEPTWSCSYNASVLGQRLCIRKSLWTAAGSPWNTIWSGRALVGQVHGVDNIVARCHWISIGLYFCINFHCHCCCCCCSNAICWL